MSTFFKSGLLLQAELNRLNSYFCVVFNLEGVSGIRHSYEVINDKLSAKTERECSSYERVN